MAGKKDLLKRSRAARVFSAAGKGGKCAHLLLRHYRRTRFFFGVLLVPYVRIERLPLGHREKPGRNARERRGWADETRHGVLTWALRKACGKEVLFWDDTSVMTLVRVLGSDWARLSGPLSPFRSPTVRKTGNPSPAVGDFFFFSDSHSSCTNKDAFLRGLNHRRRWAKPRVQVRVVMS